MNINYKTLVKRINMAESLIELQRVEHSLTNLYNWHVISEHELMKLDLRLCDKIDEMYEVMS